MSTLKPRITITLDPHVHEVLRRLSAAGGDSMSALVTGFLDVAIPPMERMVVILEKAKGMPERTKEEVRASLLRAEAKLLPAIAAATEQNDLFLAEVLEAANAAGAGRSAARTGRVRSALPPVPVTRGVGQTKKGQKGGKSGGL